MAFQTVQRRGHDRRAGSRLAQRAYGFAVGVIGVYRLLQVRYRFIALSCLHGGQPFGFGAERRIGQLFLLSFQLRAGGGDVIARAEHLQIIWSAFTLPALTGRSLIC